MQVGTASNWAAAAAGGTHTVALKSDSTLWAWGYNYYGQLGDGTTTNPVRTLAVQKNPVQVGTESNWTALAAGYDHSLAIKSDGSLWAWGDSTYGQLGIGLLGYRTVLGRVAGPGGTGFLNLGSGVVCRHAGPDGSRWADGNTGE